MVVLLILKIIAAIATAVLGMVSFIRPRAIFSFTGLTAPEARGISEIRSIFGGLFIALGVLAIFLGEPGFQMLGIS